MEKTVSYKNSNTAKNGYKEEELVCDDLNKKMDFKEIISKIIGHEYDKCGRIHGHHKCDIQSNNKKLNIQVKKYKNRQFQQLDRHWVDDIIEYIPELKSESDILKGLCEYSLLPNGTHIDKRQPIKKLDTIHYSQERIDTFISVLNTYRNQVLNYAFLGTNKEIQPDLLIGVEYVYHTRIRIVIFKIKDILDYLETLTFNITKGKTVIVLGEDHILSIQRKGGDGGKKSSNQLQFKIIISKLLNKVPYLEYKL